MTVDQQGSSADRLASRERRAVQRILRMLLLTVFVIAMLAVAAPWLRASIGAPMMYVVSVAVVTILVGYSAFFEFSQARELDEVQRASQQFAVRWGASAGQFAFVLLMFLPPFQNGAVAIVNGLAGQAPESADHKSVILVAGFLGFAALLVLQALATTVFGVIWWKRSQH